MVKSTEPRARFLFSGYEGDPAPFWERAEQAGIADVSRFLGRIPHGEFAMALNAADIFISVPSVDATAVSLLEAMSCDSAILVSSLPSSVEWIRDGESGLVVEPRDVDGLARAMLHFADDGDLRRACGQAALVTARDVAGFDSNMRYVDTVFRRLVEGTGEWPETVALPRLLNGEGGP